MSWVLASTAALVGVRERVRVAREETCAPFIDRDMALA